MRISLGPILIYSEVAAWFDAGLAVDVALLDFLKGFVLVLHSILLGKLRERDLGVCSVLIGCVCAFLSDHTMQVMVSGATSRTRVVTSGVPQGSVLGLVLFLVYINHVTSRMVSCYKAFADDYKFYLCYKRLQFCCTWGVCITKELG